MRALVNPTRPATRTRLHHLVEEQAHLRSERTALTHGSSSLTYAELWDRVAHLGAVLADLGLDRGDRVAIFLDKRPDTVASIFGTSVADGVFVPVNPVLKAPQVSYILGDCGVRVLVTTRQRWESVREEAKECAALEHVLLVDAEPGTSDGFVHALADFADLAPVDLTGSTVDLDMAAILYTSGSTGRPKGVVLSHRNLLVGAESVSTYLANSEDDVILSALPLSFDAGLSQLTTAFSAGAHVVLLNYLLPRDVPRLCAKHGVTGLTCVPPLWLQLVTVEWPPEATASMRYLANTGGRMPRATLDRLREIFPSASPFLMYGLTEAFRSTYLDPAEVDARPDSIGKAIPNAEILVVKPDGTPCGPGEEGELVHRGPLVAMGYWGNAEKTAERFKPVPGPESDWRAPELAVWSGDRVVSDEEGYLYFVGRTDDMIKTSGYRVSPTEIEEVAYDSGLVTDAVALGLPEPGLGHRVVLLVSPYGGDTVDTTELLAIMRRTLPLYMVPAEVVVRPELPRSPNGKFDRVLLRQQLETALDTAGEQA
ncbi:acyl-CoA ligase (AMP-forming), exosortase A system-associated [Nocardioides oleivorans]|uniref:Acyl-CoA ligase (AMP-forming), exosortase A system-associated n=1 Tax=Nocardioides oleivorans TaxID=273676 RepID=A0A4V1RL85_9ACTN|nr:acyl-CoA ligase (AMP-forming), exosortase A system-associated [Nocardioides oleivorans]RYB94902.1 acyl-CoA ligase (AMP-forming), exosortase A system-associated [Nocardioides oleivorans]